MPWAALGDSTERLLAARDLAEDHLLSEQAFAYSLTAESGSSGFGFENIVGVGISERLSRGRPTGERAVAVYVVRKAPLDQLEPNAVVPPKYGGVATDVVETGEFIAHTERGRCRPAPSGVSLAHYQDTAGTLGFVAAHAGGLVVVSNNHVLARENDAAAGDAILQPGPHDGGTLADRIAELKAFWPLDFNEPNLIDAALATTTDEFVSNEIYGIGSFVADPLEPTPDMLVRKCGRTTGVSRGIVRDVEASVKVRYRKGIARLREQIIVEPRDKTLFSDSGDSGSLVIEDSTKQPIGLLCGGTPTHSIVNRLSRVFELLGVSFPS